jgi:hypothetical protein
MAALSIRLFRTPALNTPGISAQFHGAPIF